jgi:HSP20 family molecular chaperone IbpA
MADTTRAWTPAIDVERDNGNLVVRADVPGIKAEEVKSRRP